jgi:hypothetical protein
MVPAPSYSMYPLTNRYLYHVQVRLKEIFGAQGQCEVRTDWPTLVNCNFRKASIGFTDA